MITKGLVDSAINKLLKGLGVTPGHRWQIVKLSNAELMECSCGVVADTLSQYQQHNEQVK